jgi:thiaminase II
MRFSEQLRQAAAGVWEAQHEHPFVRGIADGTLDPARFRAYVRQDYLFLIEYGRVLALACARAPRLELIERFAELAHSTLRTEMDLHRAYAAEWGIKRAELERERPQPATRVYTDFLLRTAALCDFAELVAALLPCMWGYCELGQRLAQCRRRPRSATCAGSRCIPARSSQSSPGGAASSATRPRPTPVRTPERACERPSSRAAATNSTSGNPPGAAHNPDEHSSTTCPTDYRSSSSDSRTQHSLAPPSAPASSLDQRDSIPSSRNTFQAASVGEPWAPLGRSQARGRRTRRRWN